MTTYSKYRQLWESALTTNYGHAFPVHLDLEMMATCNLRCTMCPHSTGFVGRNEPGMSHSTGMRVMKEARKLGALSVKFNWRSEATLYKRLNDLADYAKELGYVDIMMNTNGNWPGGFFPSPSFTWISFSVDAATKETYEKIRTRGDWDRLLKNIERTYRMWPYDFGLPPNPTCDCGGSGIYKAPHQSVEGHDDEDAWVDWSCYCRHAHGTIPQTKRMVCSFTIQEINKCEVEQFRSLCHDQLGHQISTSIKPVFDRITGNTPDTDRKFCGFPLQRLTVARSGDVFPCCVPWNENKDLSLGNVHSDSIKSIWNGERRRKLIDTLRTPASGWCDTCRNQCYSWASYEKGE